MKNVQELVGNPVLDGVLLTPKGRAKAVIGGAIGGGAGSALKEGAQMATAHAGQGVSPSPAGTWKLGYVAVTAEEVVLLEARPALIGTKATGVLAGSQRAALARVSAGDGKTTLPLHVEFNDATSWEFEIARANFKDARRVAELLSGA